MEGDFTVALPRWRSHKIVGAAKINAIDFAITDTPRLDLMPHGVVEVTAQWVREKGAHVGGYFVMYEDGYKSFSPAKAFDEGYRPLGDTELTVEQIARAAAYADAYVLSSLESNCIPPASDGGLWRFCTDEGEAVNLLADADPEAQREFRWAEERKLVKLESVAGVEAFRFVT